MRGPAKQPRHLKSIKGTLRRGRVAPETPPLPALGAAPTPPRWLTNADAVREWQRLAPILTANRLLHAGNVGLLAQLAAVHGRLVEIWTTGAKPNAALVATYRRLLNSLGLLGWHPPAAAPAAAPANKFARNAAPRKGT